MEAPSNEVQDTILGYSADVLEISRDDIGINTSLFDWGVNSIETFNLKTLIQERLKLQDEVPIIIIMAKPTIKALATEVDRVQEAHVYDPIVTLQASGARTPVFLFHPGVGEVLVFLNLAKHMTDRPVHTIRARDFDGEPCFNDIPEVVYTYYNAIKKIQPDGSYALAGYSYGAMLAFEVIKKLEANRDRVGFLASLNLAPHIKWRMRQLDFVEAMLNLSYFIGLLTDTYAHAISLKPHQLTHSEAVDFIISKAPPERMIELALDKVKLQSWADVAYRMLAIARDYDPTGNVDNMDVFYATPLSAVSNDMEDWLENFVGKWRNFVRSDVRFTLIDGAHYTMVSSFF